MTRVVEKIYQKGDDAISPCIASGLLVRLHSQRSNPPLETLSRAATENDAAADSLAPTAKPKDVRAVDAERTSSTYSTPGCDP